MIKVKKSKMSGKLSEIDAYNTNPLDNSFCKKMHASKNKNIICTKCYSVRMLETYRKNCVPRFKANGEALKKKLTIKEIQKPKTELVRFSAHGEIINKTHLINFFNICEAYPKKKMSLYTKRLDILNKVIEGRKKPKNLIVVYSNPLIDQPITKVPKNCDKVFNVLKDKYLNKVNCGAKSCNTCRMCYTKGTKIIYEKIK